MQSILRNEGSYSVSTTVSERIVDCEQGSADWLKARCGCVTSSRIADVIAKRVRGTGELADKTNLRKELVSELLTGNASDHYVSRWMKEGKEKEPLAKAEYEMRYDVEIEDVGFIYHPTIRLAGCSPDGLVGSDGMIETKCPKVETHIGYLLTDEIPEEYQPQMAWQLACADDRKWNDFVSFSPEMPKKYRLFRKRMERTPELDAIIRGMEAEACQFIEEVHAMLNRLQEWAKKADSEALAR